VRIARWKRAVSSRCSYASISISRSAGARRIAVTEVTPILFDDGLENITYRRKGCGLEMKRAFRRRSGARQPIRHTPEFHQFNDIADFPKRRLSLFCK
jgi:hypothetical protein